jgi:ubiquinone/menaquinone biosynthesis C-methylase UbiE
MDFQYAAFSKLLKGKLAFAPFIASPRYVLDVCTGTGIWAIDFGTWSARQTLGRTHIDTQLCLPAKQNPSSHVIGVDLAAIQPIPPVPNVEFVKDDARKKWLYQCKFDYVHLRLVYLSFSDPRAMMREAFDNMNPGGWIEYQDAYGQVLCKNGQVGRCHVTGQPLRIYAKSHCSLFRRSYI